ncbi:hypothetical protein U3516DRAFT_823811 [Neocallimastix sp. 'constans']
MLQGQPTSSSSSRPLNPLLPITQPPSQISLGTDIDTDACSYRNSKFNNNESFNQSNPNLSGNDITMTPFFHNNNNNNNSTNDVTTNFSNSSTKEFSYPESEFLNNKYLFVNKKHLSTPSIFSNSGSSINYTPPFTEIDNYKKQSKGSLSKSSSVSSLSFKYIYMQDKSYGNLVKNNNPNVQANNPLNIKDALQYFKQLNISNKKFTNNLYDSIVFSHSRSSLDEENINNYTVINPQSSSASSAHLPFQSDSHKKNIPSISLTFPSPVPFEQPIKSAGYVNDSKTTNQNIGKGIPIQGKSLSPSSGSSAFSLGLNSINNNKINRYEKNISTSAPINYPTFSSRNHHHHQHHNNTFHYGGVGGDNSHNRRNTRSYSFSYSIAHPYPPFVITRSNSYSNPNPLSNFNGHDQDYGNLNSSSYTSEYSSSSSSYSLNRPHSFSHTNTYNNQYNSSTNYRYSSSVGSESYDILHAFQPIYENEIFSTSHYHRPRYQSNPNLSDRQ